LKKLSYKTFSPINRWAAIALIGSDSKIPKKEKCEFLLGVLKEDTSLRAVATAGCVFRTVTDAKYSTLDVEHFVKWWESGKDSIK
jgi:hypothetical protein